MQTRIQTIHVKYATISLYRTKVMLNHGITTIKQTIPAISANPRAVTSQPFKIIESASPHWTVIGIAN
jgi:hypothetical protein